MPHGFTRQLAFKTIGQQSQLGYHEGNWLGCKCIPAITLERTSVNRMVRIMVYMTVGKAIKRLGKEFFVEFLELRLSNTKCSYKQDWPIKGSPYCNSMMQAVAQ